MNVLVIGKFYTEGFARHIAETLEGMGHAVRRFEPSYKAIGLPGRGGRRINQALELIHAATDNLPAFRARRMRDLWRVVDQGPLDAVIVSNDFLLPDEVAEIRKRSGAPVAMWYPDSIASFRRAMFMNCPYDALFFKDPFIIHTLGDVLESPVYYLPECCNPARHVLSEEDGEPDPAYACDITTAGNLHSWRVACYKHLPGYDVKLWGNAAPHWMSTGPVAAMYQGRGVYNQDKARAFLGAKIVVNHLLYSEVWGVNARCFEAAAAGAFQMVDWRPGLGHLFEDGREVIAFTGMADLKARIDYWLPREDERRVIGRAGRERALAEHTYQHRLSLLLSTLSGNDRGYPIPALEFRY